MTTKVHAIVDGLGNPLRLMLSPGNRNDICYARELLEPYDLRGRYVIADKGYDYDKLRGVAEEAGSYCCDSKPQDCKASQKY